MRRSLQRACTAITTLVLSSSWMAAWPLAFHLAAAEHHHPTDTADRAERHLDLVLHGHAHDAETPDHEHPLVGAGPAPLGGPGPHLDGAATTGPGAAVFGAPSSCRCSPPARAVLDPPPRQPALSILRI